MGADIKSLRTRIKSVDSTLHLTTAMGLVASSKIRRVLIAMKNGREYEAAVREAILPLIQSPDCQKSRYLRKPEEIKRRILIVIAGDRGLAGGYNASLFRTLKECPADTVIPIGKRACDRFGQAPVYAEGFTKESAYEMALELCRAFASGECDAVDILCTGYRTMLKQEPQVRRIFPLEEAEASRSEGTIFEPDEQTVLDLAVPEYVTGLLLGAVRESFACEIAARRCAMDSAGKNAKEMMDGLTLQYNRARQSAITQEITEIVAGSGT